MWLEFAVERETYDTVYAVELTRENKTFKTLQNALIHAEYIKTLIHDRDCIEIYRFEK